LVIVIPILYPPACARVNPVAIAYTLYKHSMTVGGQYGLCCK